MYGSTQPSIFDDHTLLGRFTMRVAALLASCTVAHVFKYFTYDMKH